MFALLQKKSFLILLLSVMMMDIACVRDKPEPSNPGNNNSEGRKVFIANEGSLGNGNASFSFYNIDKDSVYNNIYETANGQGPGDVLQSVLIDNDRIYLAVNNSDKVAVIDKSNYTLLGNIQVPKPRYLLKLSADKMYVSSLYNAQINIVNPSNFQVTGKIDVDYKNSEGLTALNDKVYACNWDTACNYIYEIDAATDAITARIHIAGKASQQVLVDKNKMLWVLAGNVYKGKTASLTQINPATKTIIKSFLFPAGADIMKPCWNPTNDTLYFLGVNYNGGTDYNGVYRMSIDDNAIPSALFIPAQPLQYFWGLAVDSVKNQIYVADPKGFIQNGTISIYQTNGIQLKSFNVGIGPGFFSFDNR
ncbi:YncE family protein [Taibaiella lutea]|nr:glutaminyl-peptide cyclotransferase [Taibaiella lutea]